MTKLYGLETLFYGTSVVYAYAEVEQFGFDIHQLLPQILDMLLISLRLC